MGKETKAQATAHTLRDQIEQGIYEAGQKLPNENDLSLQLGISRTTLREAIRILVSQGHLQVRRGSGTFVSGPLNQAAETSLDMNDMKVTLRDLYEARLIFEPQAAALAARRASDEEITDGQQRKIGEMRKVPADLWFSINKWAKETLLLTPRETAFIGQMGYRIKRGFGVTYKQAKWAMDLYEKAQTKGWSDDR